MPAHHSRDFRPLTRHFTTTSGGALTQGGAGGRRQSLEARKDPHPGPGGTLAPVPLRLIVLHLTCHSDMPDPSVRTVDNGAYCGHCGQMHCVKGVLTSTECSGECKDSRISRSSMQPVPRARCRFLVLRRSSWSHVRARASPCHRARNRRSTSPPGSGPGCAGTCSRPRARSRRSA